MGMASVTNSITAVVGGHLAPASQASISLFDFSTTNAADIFESDETTPVAQPVLTDAKGNFAFFVAAGKYTLQIQRGGVIEMIDVTFADPDGGGGGIPDAPSDGSSYGRQDAAWVVVAGTVNITTGTKFQTGRTIDGDIIWGKWVDWVSTKPNANTEEQAHGVTGINEVLDVFIKFKDSAGNTLRLASNFDSISSADEFCFVTATQFKWVAASNRTAANTSQVKCYMEWTET